MKGFYTETPVGPTAATHFLVEPACSIDFLELPQFLPKIKIISTGDWYYWIESYLPSILLISGEPIVAERKLDR